MASSLSDLLSLLSGGVAQNAYSSLAKQLSSIAEQEAQAGINYERDYGNLGYQQEDAVRRLHDAFANRGTIRSGMAVRAEAEQGRNFTSLLDQLARQKQGTLSNLAQQRIGAESNYNQTMAGLQTDFAGKSTEFIAQQMEAEAQRKANQQQILFQQQMNAMNQQLGAATQNLYKQDQSTTDAMLKPVSAALTAPQAGTAPTTQTRTPAPAPTPSRVQPSASLLPTQRIPYSPRPGSQTSQRRPV